jgi:aminopeptidase
MQIEERAFQLARIFLEHSLRITKKENVLITVSEESGLALGCATYIETLKLGAYPVMDFAGPDLNYQFYTLANAWQLSYFPKDILSAKIKWADAYVRIAGYQNSKELAQINPKLLLQRAKLSRPLIDKMIDSDRWILTEYPSYAMAQDAGVSLTWLTDFFYSACLVDYRQMQQKLTKLEKMLDRGKTVQITGKKTNLTFSIAGRLAKACYGERNIPDGEVFLAPNKNSLNGEIYFELKTEYLSQDFQGIYLQFKNGRVIKADCEIGKKSELEKILNSDFGSRYVGEFAFGANYNIKQEMKNTLFDEKIGGTIHLALGRSYREKRGGAPKGYNNSAIHWDLVKDTRIKGSTVEIDGKKILKDGKILI